MKSPSRRRRIAEGSGRSNEQIQQMLTEFTAMRAQMQTMSKMMKLGVPGKLGCGGPHPLACFGLVLGFTRMTIS